MPLTLTPREAAFVTESDVQAVQRALDGGVVRKRTQRVGGRNLRVLGLPEVWFFRALRGQEGSLTPEGRARLYKAVQNPVDGKVVIGSFVLDIEAIDRQIERRMADLEQIKSFVEDVPGGESLLKGTAVPVHVIAALAAEGGVEEAARAYPSLSTPTIEAAVAYANVYPKKGRPFPSRSLKRMLGELALPEEVFGAAAHGNGPREAGL